MKAKIEQLSAACPDDEKTEDECFFIEAAYQYGFEVLDDDALVVGCNEDQLFRFVYMATNSDKAREVVAHYVERMDSRYAPKK